MEEASALGLPGWSASSAGPLAALCAVVEEVEGDFQVEDVVVGELVAALEVEVLLTLVAVKVSPSVWLEEVDVVVLVVVMVAVALEVAVLALGVVLAVVVLVVALAVEVVLVEVVLGVVLGLSAPLVAYSKSPSTRASCNPSMWKLTLRSKK